MRGGALGHGVLRTLREAKLLEKARCLGRPLGEFYIFPSWASEDLIFEFFRKL